MNVERATTIAEQCDTAGVPWASAVPADLAARAVTVALEVAQRLCDTGSMVAPRPCAPNSAGCAVLFGQLDRYLPDGGWAEDAHTCLTHAVRSVEQGERRTLGLFGGLCEVAFAAGTLSGDGARYQRLLRGLDEVIAEAATVMGEMVARDPAGLPFATFDVISGLAGVGAYLLRRRTAPGVDEALRAVLTGLVALCGERDGLPNWHTPFTAMIRDTPMARSYPTGVLNCGLAHGVPGPLALLALAEHSGISVAGQPDAIARVARWLIAHRIDDAWGPNWPTGVPLPDPAGSTPRRSGPTHTAWCYGSPGVARALWLAGTALADSEFRAIAVETMTAVYRRPPGERRIDGSSGLCHGVAGLLQITLRFAADTGDPVFTTAATTLTAQLLDMFDPQRCFGYVTLAENGVTDDPGLLDGAAGVALTLLAAATDIAPSWDRTLVLA